MRNCINHLGRPSRRDGNDKLDTTASSQAEAWKLVLLRSRFRSLLNKIDPQLGVRYHFGCGKLEVDYDVSSEVVGSGCTGDVLLARSRNDLGNLFAVKIYKSSDFPTPEDRNFMQNEIKLLLQSDHPNVLHASDIYEDQHGLRIVTPFMAGGDLGSANLSPLQVAITSRQMLAGLQFLHNSGYIHRDVKPTNFVLDSNDDAKIIDFGLCVEWEPNGRRLYQRCGTQGFMSPEMCKGTGYTNKTDMWSLGVTIFALLEGRLPFENDSDALPSQKEVVSLLESCEGLDLRAKHFLGSLLKVNPHDRPTADQALLHPWFDCSLEDEVLASAALKQWEQFLLECQRVSSNYWADMSDMSTDDEESTLGPWRTSATRKQYEIARWVDLLSDDEDCFECHKEVSSDHWVVMSDMSTDDEVSVIEPWRSMTRSKHEAARWVDFLSDDED
jgi:serine/threonine protein kinase